MAKKLIGVGCFLIKLDNVKLEVAHIGSQRHACRNYDNNISI